MTHHPFVDATLDSQVPLLDDGIDRSHWGSFDAELAQDAGAGGRQHSLVLGRSAAMTSHLSLVTGHHHLHESQTYSHLPQVG